MPRRRFDRQQLRIVWIEAINSPLIEVIGVMVASVAIVWLATNILNPSLVPVSGPIGMWVAGSLPFALVGLLLWTASSRGGRLHTPDL